MESEQGEQFYRQKINVVGEVVVTEKISTE